MASRLFRFAAPLGAAVLTSVALVQLTAQTPPPAGTLTISVLSGRADMLTGGDALIKISGAPAADLASLEVIIDGRKAAFDRKPAADGAQGLVTGIPVGKSVLTARAGTAVAKLEVTNYPIIGPVFSGPHQKPFVCQTEAWKLGPPLDENCSVKTRVEWVYKSTTPPAPRPRPAAAPGAPATPADDDPPEAAAAAFKPLASATERPADLAMTTVNGKQVPYVVRVETGTINRAVYKIAKLEGAWNERLVYTFGGSCMAGYIQGRSSGTVLSDLHLSRGYAVASSSLNVFGNNCNGVLSAETLMMVKERFIESIGVPKHTIGWGGSGGAMAQYEIAQNYPGLLDGITPTSTFPDAATYFIDSEDCRMVLRPYLNKTSLTEEQKRAITGMSMWETCNTSYAGRPGRLSPLDCDAGIPKELRYDPKTNPTGARCSIYDGMVNIFGKDPKTGFARRPHDTVGVQYGLAALNDGTIDKAVFLDLNEKVGGYDIDTKWQAERTVGDPAAIKAVYASGQTVMGTGGLASIPIIDARGYVDMRANFHESWHSFKARARLVNANGNADNQVILRAPTGGAFAPVQVEYLEQMDRWLDAVKADTSSASQRDKVIRNKPKDLVDACWDEKGKKIADPAVYGKKSACNDIFPPHSSPRLVAGAPLSADIWKCQLKPIDWKEYLATFTDAEKARLQKIFPTGVCDWSKPGMHAAPLAGTWQRY